MKTAAFTAFAVNFFLFGALDLAMANARLNPPERASHVVAAPTHPSAVAVAEVGRPAKAA